MPTQRKTSLRRSSTMSTASDTVSLNGSSNVGGGTTTTARSVGHDDDQNDHDRSSHFIAKDMQEANEWIVQQLKSLKDAR